MGFVTVGVERGGGFRSLQVGLRNAGRLLADVRGSSLSPEIEQQREAAEAAAPAVVRGRAQYRENPWPPVPVIPSARQMQC